MTVETDEYQRRWAPSDVVVWVYALGCPGIQELARLLALPIFKIGTTEGNLQDRLYELGRDNYGTSYRTPTGLVREPGFGCRMWVAEQLPTTIELSPLSPVHPSVRAIGVRLPVGLSAPAFERRLSAEVGKASLGQIISSPAGRALCADRAVDPARCRRIACAYRWRTARAAGRRQAGSSHFGTASAVFSGSHVALQDQSQLFIAHSAPSSLLDRTGVEHAAPAITAEGHPSPPGPGRFVTSLAALRTLLRQPFQSRFSNLSLGRCPRSPCDAADHAAENEKPQEYDGRKYHSADNEEAIQKTERAQFRS